MSVNGITNTGPLVETTSSIPPVKPIAVKTKEIGSNNTGVIYEKSAKEKPTTTNQTDIIAKMKAESDERTAQFRSLVEKIILKQSATSANATSIYNFLAKGDFTVDEATKLKAQADIAENGYWGSIATSDRIVDFAKALASNDPKKAEALKEAFKKGYAQAEKTWGGKLPEICQETHRLVLEKLDQWASSI